MSTVLYQHCPHCPRMGLTPCDRDHTVPCSECEQVHDVGAQRVVAPTLVESINTVLKGLSEIRSTISDKETPGLLQLTSLLEGFVDVLTATPEQPSLFDQVWGALPPNSGVTRTEVKLILGTVHRALVEEIDTYPEPGARQDFLDIVEELLPRE